MGNINYNKRIQISSNIHIMESPEQYIDKNHRRIKQHVIAKTHTFFAIVHPGFENTSKRELHDLGITSITDSIDGGIEFKGKLDQCYIVNLSSRTVTRLIMRLSTFKVSRFNDLKKKINQVPWELYIDDGMNLSFQVTSSKSKLYHTDRIREECEKGIRSRLTDYNKEIHFSPDSEPEDTQIIFIRIADNICTVSLDSSGELLYKRKEKPLTAKATIRETLAASILKEAKIEKYDLILDPMCGSGTFSLEGAGIQLGKIPGFNRRFSFMKWPAFRQNNFDYIKNDLIKKYKVNDKENLSLLSDIDPVAIETAEKNIQLSTLESHIKIEKRDFLKEPIRIPESRKTLMVLNPPYGTRLKNHDIEKLYRKIGNLIRKEYSHSGYAIIVPSLELEKILSLTYDRKIIFTNGGIRVAVIIKDRY